MKPSAIPPKEPALNGPSLFRLARRNHDVTLHSRPVTGQQPFRYLTGPCREAAQPPGLATWPDLKPEPLDPGPGSGHSQRLTPARGRPWPASGYLRAAPRPPAEGRRSWEHGRNP